MLTLVVQNPVPTALRFQTGNSLDKYVETDTSIYKYADRYSCRLVGYDHWRNNGAQSLRIVRTYTQTTDALDVFASIGYESLIGFDIVVDKTSQTIGLW